jgi:hypothetical protein
MKITLRGWILLALIAVFCAGLWVKFEYPHFSFVNFPVDKHQALSGAKAYLALRGVDTEKYAHSLIFDRDKLPDRFLQKVIGLTAENEFIRKHAYEIFYWRVRFFKEFQKEEYILYVSPASGNIINFQHLIEDIEPRVTPEEETAKKKAEEFLQKNFGLNFSDYRFNEEKIKRYDNRIDYSFSWEKKEVYIQWKKGEGGAKLLTGATVSGNEIREFYKNKLNVPEKFSRYVENQIILGEYLYSFYFILFSILLGFAVYTVIRRKSDFVTRRSKKMYYYLAAIFFLTNLSFIFNNLQNIIMYYPTSSQLSSFLGLNITKEIIYVTFLTASFLLPGLAGESLSREVIPEKKYCSLFYFVRYYSYNRAMSKAILLGYAVFLIMLGVQASVFYYGEKLIGVWREWFTMTQFSSAYLPVLSVFTIGLRASIIEEVTFRFYGINLLKKYLKNVILAIILVSVIWGLGHTAYAIFPVWFRIIEISLIGILLGFIFVRYGIIPVIVAHYLFDVFWSAAAFILGRSNPYLFYSSLFILCSPLGFAIIAFMMNRQEEEKDIEFALDKVQLYNLDVLKAFIQAKKNQGLNAQDIREELINHNWDTALIDLAIKELF